MMFFLCVRYKEVQEEWKYGSFQVWKTFEVEQLM